MRTDTRAAVLARAGERLLQEPAPGGCSEAASLELGQQLFRPQLPFAPVSSHALFDANRRRAASHLTIMKSVLLMLFVAVAAAGCASDHSSQKSEARGTREAPLSRVELQELSAGWKTDFARHSVPLREFQSGGPGKDGIPALDRPRFLPAAEVGFLRPREPVIALTLAGHARAYPLQILTWHEIVNDVVAGVPVAVSFCPLCNTAIAFDRRVDGRTLSFGTTGNLRNSDLVMYDRQTESWWQQFGGEGVVGRYAGARLRVLPGADPRLGQFPRPAPLRPRPLAPDRLQPPLRREPVRRLRRRFQPALLPDSQRGRQTAAAEGARRVPRARRLGGRDPVLDAGEEAARRGDVAGHRFEVRWQGGVSSALDSSEIASGRDVGAAQVFEQGRPTTFSEPFWFAVAAFRPHVQIVR
jgi:Protein of unknown function (DUF3179)